MDMFDILVEEGVEQLCWGMKKIVEIGIDATCEHSKDSSGRIL